MFEHRHEKLLPRRLFIRRLAKFALISLTLVVASLIIGMIGYYTLEGFSWVDSFLNSAMLMGGMGPIETSHRRRKNICRNFRLVLRLHRASSHRHVCHSDFSDSFTISIYKAKTTERRANKLKLYRYKLFNHSVKRRS